LAHTNIHTYYSLDGKMGSNSDFLEDKSCQFGPCME